MFNKDICDYDKNNDTEIDDTEIDDINNVPLYESPITYIKSKIFMEKIPNRIVMREFLINKG